MEYKKFNNDQDKFRKSCVEFLNKEINNINLSRK